MSATNLKGIEKDIFIYIVTLTRALRLNQGLDQIGSSIKRDTWARIDVRRQASEGRRQKTRVRTQKVTEFGLLIPEFPTGIAVPV